MKKKITQTTANNTLQQAADSIGTSHLYIKGIDGLRAAAVLAVLLFHLNPSIIPGGFTGVDIFFVISGYVVSASLARHPAAHFFRFAADFYARRIIRIFPALIVCLLVASLLTTLFIPASWLSYTSNKTGLAAFVGLGNFALILFNDGYFSPRSDFNPFTHTWSLGVEEQFYLVFPVIFFIWRNYKKQEGMKRTIIRGLLPVLLLLSLFCSYQQTSANPDAAFYLLPARFWELGAGAFLFQLHTQQRLLSGSKYSVQMYLSAGIILITAGFIFSKKQSFPFPWALLPVLGTVSLISGLRNSIDEKVIIQRILECQPVVYIGKISYSLYLWHWPVYVLFRWTSGLQSLLETTGAVAITVISATVSYHFIEQRIRTDPQYYKQASPKIICNGMKAITVSCLSAGLIFLSQPIISLSVTKNKKTWYPHPWSQKITHRQEKIFAGRKIFAIGDSHTGAYSTMLQQFSDEYGAEFRNMSQAGCGIANLTSPKITKGKRCAQVFEEYIAEIQSAASKGDIVFFASLRMNRLCDQWTTFSRKDVVKAQQSERAAIKRVQALEETARIIHRLKKMQLHVIIDAPKPVFASPPFRCSDWFNRSNPVCAAGFTLKRKFLLSHRQPVMNSLETLAAAFPASLTVWDPFPLLCDDKICSAFDKDDKPLFFDGDHLSAHGNRVLYSSFTAMVKKIWLAK
ncbi:MAG: acyltransferase [Candidatus Electrothrix sp. AW3_4]|nr:acyltransferase [Candidatus Electrothrix gigas]